MIGIPFYSDWRSSPNKPSLRRMNRCNFCGVVWLPCKLFPAFQQPFISVEYPNGSRSHGTLIVCNDCNRLIQPDRKQPQMISVLGWIGFKRAHRKSVECVTHDFTTSSKDRFDEHLALYPTHDFHGLIDQKIVLTGSIGVRD